MAGKQKKYDREYKIQAVKPSLPHRSLPAIQGVHRNPQLCRCLRTAYLLRKLWNH